MVSYFPEGSPGIGTCTMIGPKLAITAMHNVYNKEKKMFTNKVDIYPGCNGPNITDINLDVVSVHALQWNKEYEWEGKSKDDWCLLVLDTDMSYKTGYCGVARSYTPTQFLGYKVTVSGYPGDLNKPLMPDHKIDPNIPMYQFYCDGTITRGNAGLLNHTCSTMKGDSGAGIITDYEGEKRVIGVHTLGGEPVDGASHNTGPYIDEWTFNEIMKYKNGLP